MLYKIMIIGETIVIDFTEREEEMKKKLLMAMMVMVLAVGMTACGSTESTDKESKVEESKQDKEEDKDKEKDDTEGKKEEKEEKKKEQDLPNWNGVQDNIRNMVTGVGSYGIHIKYPSMKPPTIGCAYQKDAALVLVVTGATNENYEELSFENVEDPLLLNNFTVNMDMEDYRGFGYTDFKFDVSNKELMTFNDMPTCMYEGTHSYVKDGETISLPYVAYTFYTGQLEGYSYYTVYVIDDSINRTAQDPLAEGTIQAYAKKMMESVVLDD